MNDTERVTLLKKVTHYCVWTHESIDNITLKCWETRKCFHWIVIVWTLMKVPVQDFIRKPHTQSWCHYISCRTEVFPAKVQNMFTSGNHKYLVLHFVTQLFDSVWRTVLQMSRTNVKKQKTKHPAFFLHLVVKTPNSMTVYQHRMVY